MYIVPIVHIIHIIYIIDIVFMIIMNRFGFDDILNIWLRYIMINLTTI